MKTESRISLRRVSEVYRVDFALVMEWAEFGLYTTVGDEPSIESDSLERLKRIISLHRALGVNKEGIEVVLNLSQRIADLETELVSLKAALEKHRRGWGIESMAIDS